MTRARQLANCLDAVGPITAVARMPNMAWVAFLSGPLTPADWALIERVESGEITVDDAMASREALRDAA